MTDRTALPIATPTEPAGYESSVRERYSQAAQEREAALCCPVDYDPRWLDVIPTEVIERDYGCGDPSRYVRPGETVLDLGSGGGKICFIAAQVVGAGGRVIGVDMNDDMLALARSSAPKVADAIGYANVEFRKGKIQDLALDRDLVDAYLKANPVSCETDWQRLEAHCDQLRQQSPMVADNSIDVVVSNCVLNLVDPADKAKMFAELYRVLKPGGRAVISDIVAAQPIPATLQRDPDLWSGCISGAYEEAAFLAAFAAASFAGMHIAELQPSPWQVVAGIAFRSMTVIAHKPAFDAPAESNETNQAIDLIYRGPFTAVMDEAGHEYERGVRVTVTGDQRRILQSPPYAEHFTPVDDDPNTECGPNCC